VSRRAYKWPGARRADLCTRSLKSPKNTGSRFCQSPRRGTFSSILEGDPFVGLSGREYLFGLVLADASSQPNYECRWALNAADEKEAFKWFVDTGDGSMDSSSIDAYLPFRAL
jgi:hypothetical protein